MAINLVLEEWHHWLEGAELPFLVWTVHKNLEYLQTAKRLNPRQARWALFFQRFNFTLSYCPGSKNGKPDALSCQFNPSEEEQVVEHIIIFFVMVRAHQLDIARRIQQASSNHPVPDVCPGEGCPFPSPSVVPWFLIFLIFCFLHLVYPPTVYLVAETSWLLVPPVQFHFCILE